MGDRDDRDDFRGRVWFKAAGAGTAFEAGLYGVLARVVPDRVLVPLATDARRAWMLLPDGGPVLGETARGPVVVESMMRAVAGYGHLQRALEPHVADLLAAGVPDMRPAVMPRRFEEALGVAAASPDPRGPDIARRAGRLRAQVSSWCEQLVASPLQPSLDHNDLHPWNMLDGGNGPVRYYDWGDSALAHPFAAMLVPLALLARRLGAGPEDLRMARVRDAYLEVFGDVAPPEELAGTLAVACRVAKIARVLTWERALRASREQGKSVDPGWKSAAAATLASVLEPSYAGAG